MAFAAALWTAFPRRIPDVESGYDLSARPTSSFSPSSLLNEEG